MKCTFHNDQSTRPVGSAIRKNDVHNVAKKWDLDSCKNGQGNDVTLSNEEGRDKKSENCFSQ